MSTLDFVASKSTVMRDVVKETSSFSIDADVTTGEIRGKKAFWSSLTDHGVEIRGALPVPVEERVDRRFFNIFTVFSTSMLSLLP
jgi:hypothetical protein